MHSVRTLWRHGVQKDSKARYHTESPKQQATVSHHTADVHKPELYYIPDFSKIVGGAGMGMAVATVYRKNFASGMTKKVAAKRTDLSTTDVVRHFSMDSCFTA
jgi:hypothetical protein